MVFDFHHEITFLRGCGHHQIRFRFSQIHMLGLAPLITLPQAMAIVTTARVMPAAIHRCHAARHWHHPPTAHPIRTMSPHNEPHLNRRYICLSGAIVNFQSTILHSNFTLRSIQISRQSPSQHCRLSQAPLHRHRHHIVPRRLLDRCNSTRVHLHMPAQRVYARPLIRALQVVQVGHQPVVPIRLQAADRHPLRRTRIGRVRVCHAGRQAAPGIIYRHRRLRWSVRAPLRRLLYPL